MALKEQYLRAKTKLLNDEAICRRNRDLFAEFLSYEEYKLKRMNNRPSLDDGSYKTLLSYTTRLRVVNGWFQNKCWRDLEKNDIRQVYDALEDGEIKSRFGQPLKDKRTYYKLILRGKPFELAGKKQLVVDVMQFLPSKDTGEVRFIREEGFRRLIEVTSKIQHRTFLWLCWDIGENATSILKLRKRDCRRQISEGGKDAEYLIHLRKEILKRSRRSRTEITNYPETVTYLDLHLKSLGEDDPLFDFGVGWGKKVLRRAVERTGIRSFPGGERITLKDLRSSMACDLLSKGWSRDEVNSRLGHAPSSSEIDRYINYLAIDRHRPKGKLQQHELGRLTQRLAAVEEREKRTLSRLHKLKELHEAQKGLLQIHSHIAAVNIERQLGRVSDKHYSDVLLRFHRGLIAAGKRVEDCEIGFTE